MNNISNNIKTMEPIQLIGKADDLYCVERDGQIKSIGTVMLAEDEENGCDLNITLSSLSLKSNNYEHPQIDKLLGHNVKFTVEVID